MNESNECALHNWFLGFLWVNVTDVKNVLSGIKNKKVGNIQCIIYSFGVAQKIRVVHLIIHVMWFDKLLEYTYETFECAIVNSFKKKIIGHLF